MKWNESERKRTVEVRKKTAGQASRRDVRDEIMLYDETEMMFSFFLSFSPSVACTFCNKTFATLQMSRTRGRKRKDKK